MEASEQRTDQSMALLALYDRALPQVYGYFVRRVPTAAIAEDLTAEVFLAAVRAVHEAKVEQMTTAWLIGVARHKLVDHWRRAAREERSLELASDAAATADDWTDALDPGRAMTALATLGAHHRARARACATSTAWPWPRLLVCSTAPSTPPRPCSCGPEWRSGGPTRREATMADPLDALRLPEAPLAPRRAFAADLRHRIERELDPEEDTMPSTTTTTTTTATALVPYVIVADAAAALDFYARAFGAVEVLRLEGADGRIGHAEVDLGGSRLMLADAYPEHGVVGPADLGGSPVLLHLEVPDADATFAQAVAAGATVLRPVEDQFYGARSGQVVDPFGHRWAIQTITRAMTQDEMQRGLDELESE